MVKNIVLFMALFMASPALACGVLENAEPKVGSIVASTDHLTLNFSQAFVPASSDVKITDVSGREMKTEKLTSSKDDTVLSLKTNAPLAPGKYKVFWNLLWRDCNSKTQGDYKFTVSQ